MEIKLDFRWTIAQHDIDPVLFVLLESIQRLGSLQKATQKADVSYRFAWGLLNKWQDILGQPLVILERGRGARLSTAGEALVNENHTLLARFSPELANISTQFKREFETVLSTQLSPRTTIFASHGLAISALRDLMHQQSELKLDLHFHGSLESLRALEQKQCQIAGFHIPQHAIAKEIAPLYLNVLSPDQHQLIYVVTRQQGLMVERGNPKRIENLYSLLDADIEFINRQRDSGTRLLFDQLLQAESINTTAINGYHNEEFTHMAVAAMIAGGAANVGFGIAPMADKFNLDFIPIIPEHYCLAVPRLFMQDPQFQQIITILQSDRFKQNLAGLTGYDMTRSGQLVEFDEIFP